MKKLNLLGNGFIRREDLDFTDDGARFTAYEYNGLIITKSTYEGEYFISIRIDYLKDVNFIYYDYCDKDWYKLCDKFNGVYEIDVEDLKATMDIIKDNVEALKLEVEKDSINTELMENRLIKEQKMLKDFIDSYKMIDITKYNTYDIGRLVRHLDTLKSKLDLITKELATKDYSRQQYKSLQKHNYIHIDNIENNFYTKEILQIINK